MNNSMHNMPFSYHKTGIKFTDCRVKAA
jgi:hypothetical protein